MKLSKSVITDESTGVYVTQHVHADTKIHMRRDEVSGDLVIRLAGLTLFLPPTEEIQLLNHLQQFLTEEVQAARTK